MNKPDFAELKEKLTEFDFGKWWFFAGGHLHRLWKTKQYTVIFEQARELPREAAKHQFEKDAAIITELIEIIQSQSEALEEITGQHSELCQSMKTIRPSYVCHAEIAEQALSETNTRLQKLREGK